MTMMRDHKTFGDHMRDFDARKDSGEKLFEDYTDEDVQAAQERHVEVINRAFPGTTAVPTEEYKRPGSKLSGRTYGVGDELVTKQQKRQAEELGIKVNGQSRKAAAKKIAAARMSSLKQVGYIVKLINERKGNPAIEPIRKALADSWNATGETRFETGEKIVAFDVADNAIKSLLAIPVGAAVEPAQAPVVAPEPRKGGIRITNRYPGKCDQCGETVEPGEGIWELADDGNRTVSHKAGECPMALGIPNGRYAVEHEGTLKFYVVKPSGLFVKASDEEHKIKAKAYIDAVVALIKVDPLEAMKRYGQSIGHCGRCGRTLTDEISRSIGIGPICLEKGI